jgi:hypothetical protein
MAAPTSYTEDDLALYMLSVVGKIATDVLEWDIDNFAGAVDEALLVYGTDSITAVTGRANIQILRAAARREAWRAVMQATAHEHAWGASQPGAVNTSRQQIHDHAKAMFEQATAELQVLVPTAVLSGFAWEVGVTKVAYGDPYESGLDTDNEWSRVN